MLDFGVPLGVLPHRGEFLSGTDMYHHAKCHANRCHRRRDICNRIDKLSTNHLDPGPLFVDS